MGIHKSGLRRSICEDEIVEEISQILINSIKEETIKNLFHSLPYPLCCQITVIKSSAAQNKYNSVELPYQLLSNNRAQNAPGLFLISSFHSPQTPNSLTVFNAIKQPESN